MNLSPLSWSRQDDRFFVSFGHEFGINPENAYFRIFGMGFVKNTTRRIQHLQYFNKRRHFKYILFLFLKNINLQITEWLWRSGRQELQPDLRDLPPPSPERVVGTNRQRGGSLLCLQIARSAQFAQNTSILKWNGGTT